MAEEFGLWAHCPNEAQVAWGARAILANGRTIDLVPDRQSWRGDLERRQAFAVVLEPALAEARRECYRLAFHGDIVPSEHKLVTLYKGPGVKILGNTNQSYGYLYLIAFPHECEKQVIPTPIDELPPKRCGVNYRLHDSLPVPKTAKFQVMDCRLVRYFTQRRAAQRHADRLNRDCFDARRLVRVAPVP